MKGGMSMDLEVAFVIFELVAMAMGFLLGRAVTKCGEGNNQRPHDGDNYNGVCNSCGNRMGVCMGGHSTDDMEGEAK